VEQQEALEPRALIGQLPDPVEHQVHYLLADGVVPSGVVIGRILLAGDELLRMEELAVSTCADFVHHGGFEVHEHGPGDMFAGSGLGEEGVERVIATADGLVRGHLAVGLDAMFQAVELPASVASLDAGLTHVDGDALTHGCCCWWFLVGGKGAGAVSVERLSPVCQFCCVDSANNGGLIVLVVGAIVAAGRRAPDSNRARSRPSRKTRLLFSNEKPFTIQR